MAKSRLPPQGESIPSEPQSESYLDAYLDSHDLTGEARTKAKADILIIMHVAKVGFTKPSALSSRPRAKPADLDQEVLDTERVRAARRLLSAHYRRHKGVFLTEAEIEQVRAAARLVSAANRRRRKHPSP